MELFAPVIQPISLTPRHQRPPPRLLAELARGGRYGYLPYGTYGPYHGDHREFGHGLGHGAAVGANHAGIGRLGGDFGGFSHGSGVARFGGGFDHGISGGVDHGAGFAHAGGFSHGMAAGFHGGGGGHR